MTVDLSVAETNELVPGIGNKVFLPADLDSDLGLPFVP